MWLSGRVIDTGKECRRSPYFTIFLPYDWQSFLVPKVAQHQPVPSYGTNELHY